jgi:hypothetical protein
MPSKSWSMACCSGSRIDERIESICSSPTSTIPFLRRIWVSASLMVMELIQVK